jgi:hypothetical protein
MARDAIVCHLSGLLKDGEDIPEDPFARSQPVTEELGLTVQAAMPPKFAASSRASRFAPCRRAVFL